MDYAVYILKVKRSEIRKTIRDYKEAVTSGETLNYVLTVEAYEKHLDDLNKAIERLES